jgi:Zn-dependent protease/CBS domain-containing protein
LRIPARSYAVALLYGILSVTKSLQKDSACFYAQPVQIMRIGRIFGIDIFVNVSWLFVFALVAWSLASNVWPLHGMTISPLTRSVLAVVTAMLFFCSVLLHELAHSLLARARGIPIKGITLFIFGGVSMLEREADSAPSEIWISLIGPLTSLALFVFFLVVVACIAQGQDLTTTASALPDGLSGLRGASALAATYLAIANLMLAVFNLLPAYPLDGGRILHGLLWRFSKNRSFATTCTVIVGRVIAGLIIAWGLTDIVLEGLGGGAWMTLIGIFLLQAGESERVAARLGDALRGHTAAELAVSPVLRLAADTNADAALAQLLHHQINAAPVYVGERFIGIVTLQDLVRVSDPARTYTTAVMTQSSELDHISADADAGEVTRRLSRGAQTMLPVLDAAGELVGFITREGVIAWMGSRGQETE